MSELKGKNLLVLGGSGVLGSLIASEAQKYGATVMATASKIESADRLPSIVNPRLILDFLNPESVDVLVSYLIDSKVPIDGIINAAGVVAFGNYSDLDSKTLDQLFQINALGPIKLIQGLMEPLRTSAKLGNDPFVVTISGVVAEAPMAGLAAYSASKSALHSFFEAAARELRREGIRVLDARPGHTETGLATRAIAGVAPAFPAGMEPSQVAMRIVKAILDDEKDLPSSSF